VVADSRPAATCRSMIAPMSFSMMGLLPSLMRSTFVGSESTPMTS